jgi:hypothetical protein
MEVHLPGIQKPVFLWICGFFLSGATKRDVAVFTESAAVKVRYIVINVRTEDRGPTARRTSLDLMS